ncbi:hypothetical protein LOY38_28915 [Pseudomonas sp. B21-015]|uniref:hypothetical protein n=1 Tax=Pseudomonas sp. B21-015 TaxID=2895473 RepID=UPI00215DD7FF|nr:hypothetical protein [Pseudomonas sp. B21-015]UVM53366.1 hypothetical protein LOY38_28915 [Pseudomonas sp. B21-015]
MRNRRTISPVALIASLIGAAVLVLFATPVISNALMLLMDRANFIPAESSIRVFEPYEINQGSSSYWLYGEDRVNYYYFAYTPENAYRVIAKSNQCAGFDKRDVRTWCTP